MTGADGLPNWREVRQPLFQWPPVREHLTELAGDVRAIRERAPELALHSFDPEEPYLYLERRGLLPLEVEWAYYLLAYSWFESWLADAAYCSSAERGYAATALDHIDASKHFDRQIGDYEDMKQRASDLGDLRNEIAHRGGAWNPPEGKREVLKRLLDRGEIAPEDSDTELGPTLLRIADLGSLTNDLRQIILVTHECSAERASRFDGVLHT